MIVGVDAPGSVDCSIIRLANQANEVNVAKELSGFLMTVSLALRTRREATKDREVLRIL